MQLVLQRWLSMKICHCKLSFYIEKNAFKVPDLEAFTELNKNSLFGQSAVDSCTGTDGFYLKTCSFHLLHLAAAENLLFASSEFLSYHLAGIGVRGQVPGTTPVEREKLLLISLSLDSALY